MATSSHRFYSREWLYRLVMFPSYFTPCHNCTMGNRTPKREQLLTLFDTQCPAHVYCSHCPEFKACGAWLLQVRLAQGPLGSMGHTAAEAVAWKW